MTKTMQVVTRGAAWSGFLLYDDASWGEGVDADEAAQRVIETFELLCFDAGWESIYWEPRTSAVYASTEDAKKIDPDILSMLLEQAIEQVVDEIANEE